MCAAREVHAPDSPMFRHRDKVQPMTYTAALVFLRLMQERVGASTKPALHGVRVTGNNLSRNGNGEELTQVHGGWLSVAGRSRYDRYQIADVLGIPARMLGRTPPQSGEAVGPREVVRFSHLQRTGPAAGDPAQRLVLPADLEGATLTGRATPPATMPALVPDTEEAAPVAPRTHGAGLAGCTLQDLDTDARGDGTLLPRGYTATERSASVPRSTRTRVWKEYFAPDGTKFQSRAEAWRHFTSASSRPIPPMYSVEEGDAADAPQGAGVEVSPSSALGGSLGGSVASGSPGSASSFFDSCARRPRAGPSPACGAPASVAQRHRGLAVPPSDVAAALVEVARAGGVGSRIARELM